MKKLLLLAVFACFSVSVFAQMTKENNYGINKLKIEARTDFDCFIYDDATNSGFNGKILNFIIAGDINDNFYYAYRQRLNKIQRDYNFFDATDYLYLGWRITKNLSLTTGKEIVAMGGIEYDLAPIDVYFHSNFWDNFSCYRFGANLEYTTNNGKNTFTFQFTNSPFDKAILFGSLYNYSLHWRANYKHFGPVCSVNMYEYKKGTFMNVIALGTTYQFGPVVGYLDFTNRANSEQKDFFFKDITVIGRLGVNLFNNKLQLFAKGGFDINESQDINIPIEKVYDICVLPGTDIKFCGGGFEFYPLKNSQNIRIHGFFAVSDVIRSVENHDEEHFVRETAKDKISYQVNLGVTWRLNFINK